MVVIYVEHFLDSEGQRIFPDWIKEVARELKNFEGFVALRQLKLIDDPTACHLILEFESLAYLRKWSASDVHAKVVARLAPYRTKPQEAKLFQVAQKFTADS